MWLLCRAGWKGGGGGGGSYLKDDNVIKVRSSHWSGREMTCRCGWLWLWVQFYFLQFMAVCEIGSNNTMDELSHSNSGCVWRFVMKRWWGHIRAEINTSIRSPVITGWGQAARNKYREQTLCDDVMWCDIWPTVAQALNVGRAMLWLCPGPTKKVYSYWPPTIGLETIPALNANINKNLKLIFLVRQRDRGLCCLQHTWDI